MQKAKSKNRWLHVEASFGQASGGTASFRVVQEEKKQKETISNVVEPATAWFGPWGRL